MSARRRQRAPGQALVEFAVVLPIIVLVVLGLFDLGRAVFTVNTLSQSARQANRMAIVDQNVSRVRARAAESAPTLGLASGDVDVCFKTIRSTQTDCNSSTDDCPESVRVIGCLAIVRAHVSFNPLTPVISVFFSTIPLSSTSIAPIEYVCPTGTKTTCP